MEATSASVAVVDTNAIVRGVRLENIAARCVSTREVQAEVRDKQSRHTLATLPFGLETREPDEQSVAAVRRFATLTGDAAVLSGVDTRLLALALCLEKEAHGGAHLRDKPPPPAAVKRRHTPAVPLPGWDFVTHPEEWEPLDREEEAQAARLALAQVGGTAAAENACAADNDAGQPPSRVGTRVQALIAEEPAVRDLSRALRLANSRSHWLTRCSRFAAYRPRTSTRPLARRRRRSLRMTVAVGRLL